MKTIQAIVELAKDASPDSVFAMATVMNVRGSAYRRPGARMLMTQSGRSAGMISGGCLENDVRERAQEVMATGQPMLVTYDSGSSEEIVFGLGLGCNGIVQILIERICAREPDNLLAFLAACVGRRHTGRVFTIFRAEGVSPGTRALRWPDGRVTTNCQDPTVAAALVEAVQRKTHRRTAIQKFALPDGSISGVLHEAISPPVPLTIFGAGDDAIPLAQQAKSVGWHVTVIDARPAFAKAERFPMADAVLCLRPESLSSSSQVVFPPESMVMVMTHHFLFDKELLRTLLPLRLRYVGILGPKSRTQRLLDDLLGEGAHFAEGELARLHGPAGLDIGAETPEEIAVSILSEMQSVLAQRKGGALRDRNAPIHEPVAPVIAIV